MAERRRAALRIAWYSIPLLAVLAVLLLPSVRGGTEPATPHTGSIQIVGSETIRPVVAACAEAFMTRHPQADIVVKGGGSGDGIAALLHGIVDIGMTSRELSDRERAYARSKGIEIALVELALDGVTIIVNRANAIAALDLGQLRSIFAGSLRNWRELGGADADIVAIARTTGSGTASLFGERVMGDRPYGPSVRHLPTNEAIVAEVAARPDAIGYSSLGALRSGRDLIKTVALRTDAQAAPVSPTPESVRSGTYPLTRTLYLTATGTPSDTIKAFLDFCSSAPGQSLLQRAGYVAITPGSH